MLEIALVLVAVFAVGLVGYLSAVLTSSFVTIIGLGTLFLGLLVGVPTGFWYHVILYRFVSTKIPLPDAWWLTPSSLHRHLTDAEEHRIRPWYRIGGVGFVLSVAGGLVAIIGLLAQW